MDYQAANGPAIRNNGEKKVKGMTTDGAGSHREDDGGRRQQGVGVGGKDARVWEPSVVDEGSYA
eukprot:5687656-Lingulodinium_polyedra.AAC.1